MLKFFFPLVMCCVLLTGCGEFSTENGLPKIQRHFGDAGERPDFSGYTDSRAKKTAFFDYLAPIVQAENQHILTLRSTLQRLSGADLNDNERQWLLKLAKHYKLDEKLTPEQDAFWEALLERVDVVPASLALAQAANESAWGTSRFAIKGNNFFGQWCYERGCGLVPKKRTDGASHEVARFASAAGSVASYIYNINTHRAYKELRNLRKRQRAAGDKVTGLVLVQGLVNYSSRGNEYIKEVKGMIKANQLEKLDV